MPAIPSSNKFRNRMVYHCAADRMLMTVYCGGCRRRVHYWASDLMQVLDRFHEAHDPPWPCSRCRSREYLAMTWHVPSAAELANGLTVRRPVKKIEKWIWRNERA